MSEENLISLKDASQISGYSPDYIGQLIRSGKIPGKQIYTGITWMTTAEAVLAYKNKSKTNTADRSTEGWLIRQKRKLLIEYEIIKLFAQTFKTSLPIILFLIFTVFILLIYFSLQIVNKTTFFEQNHNTNQTVESFTF